MTINVALVTSEAIVFGCDSTASATTVMLDVYRHGIQVGEDGHATVTFPPDALKRVVTNSWSGVTKMFAIGTEDVPVVAVAAGRARLKERTVTSLALEFQRMDPSGGTVQLIAEGFREFMRGYYDQHYEDTPVPESMRDGPEFLVGGFGSSARFPALYRVRIQENTVTPELIRGATGLSWGGQANAVERVIRGCDRTLRSELEALVVDFNFEKHKTRFNYANLPLQEAVNMVSYMVLLQAGVSRFGDGIATVGGRIHIGVITRNDGVAFLNEPTLRHKFTGFFDED